MALLVLAFVLVRCSGAQIQDIGALGFSTNSHEISDLFFLDSSHGWMTAEDHESHRFYLFSTNDGGKSWAKSESPSGLLRIFFVDPKVGWGLQNIGPSSAYLLRTSTGGKTWTRSTPELAVVQDAEGTEPMDHLAFSDSRTGWMVSGSGRCLILQTSDGGETLKINHGPGGTLRACYGIYASNRAGVWIYGDQYVLHSSDQGKTWQTAIDPERDLNVSPAAFGVNSVFFRDDGHGWMVGTDPYGMILATADFGRHWRLALEWKEIGAFGHIWFWDAIHGCAEAGEFFKCTADGGSTWQSHKGLPARRSQEQSSVFAKFVMFGTGRGSALRVGGYLYQTVDGGQTWQDFDPLTEFNQAAHP
jgi:photosystem II stability/assembly factor-like uncharacterized protein